MGNIHHEHSLETQIAAISSIINMRPIILHLLFALVTLQLMSRSHVWASYYLSAPKNDTLANRVRYDLHYTENASRTVQEELLFTIYGSEPCHEAFAIDGDCDPSQCLEKSCEGRYVRLRDSSGLDRTIKSCKCVEVNSKHSIYVTQ